MEPIKVLQQMLRRNRANACVAAKVLWRRETLSNTALLSPLASRALSSLAFCQPRLIAVLAQSRLQFQIAFKLCSPNILHSPQLLPFISSGESGSGVRGERRGEVEASWWRLQQTA